MSWFGNVVAILLCHPGLKIDGDSVTVTVEERVAMRGCQLLGGCGGEMG